MNGDSRSKKGLRVLFGAATPLFDRQPIFARCDEYLCDNLDENRSENGGLATQYAVYLRSAKSSMAVSSTEYGSLGSSRMNSEC